MVVSSLGVILTVLVVTIHVQACYKIMKYKKEVDEKNMQLMQFYLDSRFMNLKKAVGSRICYSDKL